MLWWNELCILCWKIEGSTAWVALACVVCNPTSKYVFEMRSRYSVRTKYLIEYVSSTS